MTNNVVGRFAGGSPADRRRAADRRLLRRRNRSGDFRFDPASLFGDAVRAMRRMVELGFTDIRQVGRILLTGAMVVVPVWLALRLLDSRGRR